MCDAITRNPRIHRIMIVSVEVVVWKQSIVSSSSANTIVSALLNTLCNVNFCNLDTCVKWWPVNEVMKV